MRPEDYATNANDQTGKYRMLILNQWERDMELTLLDHRGGEAFVTTDVFSAQDVVEEEAA